LRRDAYALPLSMLLRYAIAIVHVSPLIDFDAEQLRLLTPLPLITILPFSMAGRR